MLDSLPGTKWQVSQAETKPKKKASKSWLK